MQVPTIHGHFYSMSGHTTSGKWFQHTLVHGLHASKTECARLSLTFRMSAHLAKRNNWTSAKTQIRVISKDNFHNVGWTDIMAEIQPALEPDITHLYGKEFSNNGRMSAELMQEQHWADPSEFTYKYSKHLHIGKKMGPIVSKLVESVTQEHSDQCFDWVHATYYPTGKSKLSAHSDSEPEIALGSAIACLTFMEKPGVIRNVFIRDKPKPRLLLPHPPSKRHCGEQMFVVPK